MTARAGTASRDPLGCQFELRHFGVWRWAVAAVGLATSAVLLAWSNSGSTPRPASTMLAAAAAVVVLGFAASSLLRVQPGTLGSVGGRWWFVARGAEPAEPETGALTVAIDLGGFMLLSLRRPGAGRRWLPAQRRGHEAQWHALRCAVHAPRPQAAGAPAASE